MRHSTLFLIGLIFSALACGLFTPASTPDLVPDSATEDCRWRPRPICPHLSAQYRRLLPRHRPRLLKQDYLLQDERLINGYAVRIWRNPDDQLGFDSILLIEAAGKPTIRVAMFSALHNLTGSDLNADGYPDLVVETYSGGAHCCFGTQVFSLKPNGTAATSALSFRLSSIIFI